MLNEPFFLPSFMDDNTDMALIDKVKEHIKVLELQKCALHFLNLFIHFPEVKSITFDMKPYPHYSKNSMFKFVIDDKNIAIHKKFNNNEKQIISKLNEYINEYTDTHINFVFHLCNTKLTSNNIDKKIAKIIGESTFLKWNHMRALNKERQDLETKIKSGDKSKTLVKI